MDAPDQLNPITRDNPTMAENINEDTWYWSLKIGDACRIADEFIQQGEIDPGFIHLLGYDEWPTRMGVMVVLEDIFERQPDLIPRIIPGVKAMLSHAEENVRGDAACLLGMVGDGTIALELENMMTEAGPELREVIVDALQMIRDRDGQQPARDFRPASNKAM
ncbi:MAG: hypothetical protein HQK60_10640 [Deltaproteobacteria bacterium]|nr:hypothetical protein [Deltaproteobacteria bacterium]